MSVSLTFQIDWTHQPYDENFTGWTTIPKVQGVSYARGAPNEYGQVETGQSEVIVSDPDSNLDPNNVDSIYYAYVRRTKPMRAYVTVDDGVASTDYPLFQHFIDRMPRLQKLGADWSQRSVQGFDAFGLFALSGLRGISYPAEATGARFARVLDDIGWPALTRRAIDTGNSTLAAYTNDADSQDKALAHLLDVISNEDGVGFMAADGAATLIERHALISNTTVRAIFADDRSLDTGSYPTAFRYSDLQPEDTDIVNDYAGSRTGGSVLTASDASSIGEHGTRSQSLSFLLNSDNAVQDALDWRLSRTKDAHERVDAITVRPGDDLDLWATALSLEIGDQVQVVEYPPGYSAPVVTQYIVRHLAGNIPLAVGDASFTFQLTPSAADNWLVLDDATFGVLDSNKLAY